MAFQPSEAQDYARRLLFK